MSTSVKNILSGLAGANQIITLGLEIGGVVVPLAKGLIQEIKQIGGGAQSVSYQVLIQTDSAELEAIAQLATDDLAAINAELAKLGKPAIPALDPTAPGPAADPAPGTSSST